MSRAFAILSAAALVLGLVSTPASAQDLEVSVDPVSVEVVVGTEGVLNVTITNTGPGPSGRLVAHFVVMDPSGGGSADAEDWTTELNRLVESLEPEESYSIAWDTKPIMQGAYLALITVSPIDPTTAEPATSPAVEFIVNQPNVLVSGATVPVAAAVPFGLAAVALWVRRREKLRVASL